LPDFYKTANNEAEAFWIPGDYQGNGVFTGNTTADARTPWAIAAATGPNQSVALPGVPAAFNNNHINSFGQPVEGRSFLQQDAKPLDNLGGFYANFNVPATANDPSKKLENSEFGARLSSLLPIGNGLQASFIYLYEYRNNPVSLNTAAPGGGAVL